MIDDKNDIYEQMRKMINRRFIALLDELIFELNADTNESEQSIQKKNPEIKEKKPESKYNSLSFKYKDGNAPEIHYSGDMDEATLKKNLERVQKQFGIIGIANNDIRLVKSENEDIADIKTEDKSVDNSASFFFDMFETTEGIDISVEMPGTKQEEVYLDFRDSKLIIMAQINRTPYHKEVPLKFEPSHDAKIIANNGIITIEIKKVK